jgi:hypothetical protein
MTSASNKANLRKWKIKVTCHTVSDSPFSWGTLKDNRFHTCLWWIKMYGSLFWSKVVTCEKIYSYAFLLENLQAAPWEIVKTVKYGTYGGLFWFYNTLPYFNIRYTVLCYYREHLWYYVSKDPRLMQACTTPAANVHAIFVYYWRSRSSILVVAAAEKIRPLQRRL